MGGRGTNSRTAINIKKSPKKITTEDLPKIMTEDGRVSSFAIKLRDDIYNFFIRGEKLDVAEFMHHATSDRKKYQNVIIEYQKMNKNQRYMLANFLNANKSKYTMLDALGWGVAIYPSDKVSYTHEPSFYVLTH